MQQRTRIYLDNAATTPMQPEAQAALCEYSRGLWGNASSPYEAGRTARMTIDRARGEIAQLLGANADEIVFTGGGTESNNWALLGIALRNLEKRGHIVVSKIEHHAVLEPAETLRDLGFDVEFAPVDANGVLDLNQFKTMLRPDTLLVSLMTVNNEIGAIQPVKEAVNLARERGVLFHTDAVQAIGKLQMDVNELGVDLLSLSAHKFGGPKGVGALYLKRGVKMQALLRGGGQERGRRAGTENAPAIASMGVAAKIARENLAQNSSHLLALRERLERGLNEIAGAQINGENSSRAPHITNVIFAGRRGESLALNLDMRGIAVGTGSACASGALEPSHVLAAMGRDAKDARAALRISLGVQNTADEIDEFLSVLREII
jgi:cysteine desulfurase